MDLAWEEALDLACEEALNLVWEEALGLKRGIGLCLLRGIGSLPRKGIGSRLWRGIRSRLRKGVGSRLRRGIWSCLRRGVWYRLRRSVGSRLWRGIISCLKRGVGSRLWRGILWSPQIYWVFPVFVLDRYRWRGIVTPCKTGKHAYTNRWIDIRIGRRSDEWMLIGLMEKLMAERMVWVVGWWSEGLLDGLLICGLIDGRIVALMNELIVGWIDLCSFTLFYLWVEGWIDRSIDELNDSLMALRTHKWSVVSGVQRFYAFDVELNSSNYFFQLRYFWWLN